MGCSRNSPQQAVWWCSRRCADMSIVVFDELTNALSSVVNQWLQITSSSISLSRPAPSVDQRGDQPSHCDTQAHTHTHTHTHTDPFPMVNTISKLHQRSKVRQWTERRDSCRTNIKPKIIFHPFFTNLQLQRQDT